MSTNANIVKKQEDGTFKQIYVHWDGYPSWTGAVLEKHYNTEEAVDALLALGDLSQINPMLQPTEKHTWAEPQDGVVIAYGRDRGEKGNHTKPRINEEFYTNESYNYLWTKENGWRVYKYSTANGLTIIDGVKKFENI